MLPSPDKTCRGDHGNEIKIPHEVLLPFLDVGDSIKVFVRLVATQAWKRVWCRGSGHLFLSPVSQMTFTGLFSFFPSDLFLSFFFCVSSVTCALFV